MLRLVVFLSSQITFSSRTLPWCTSYSTSDTRTTHSVTISTRAAIEDNAESWPKNEFLTDVDIGDALHECMR